MEYNHQNPHLEYKRAKARIYKKRWADEGLCASCGRERHPEIDKFHKTCFGCRTGNHPFRIKEEHGYLNLEDTERL